MVPYVGIMGVGGVQGVVAPLWYMTCTKSIGFYCRVFAVKEVVLVAALVVGVYVVGVVPGNGVAILVAVLHGSRGRYWIVSGVIILFC